MKFCTNMSLDNRTKPREYQGHGPKVKVSRSPDRIIGFVRATAVPAGTAVARISYGDSVLSVRPSVCLSRPGTDSRPGEIESRSSPYDSLESLVSNEVILVPLAEEIPIERGHRYLTTIGSSSVKTVADRHRLAAYHSKHCRRAFQWYQHRWPWTTLNP